MKVKTKLISVVFMCMITAVIMLFTACEGGTKSPECAHKTRLPTFYTGEDFGICDGSQIIVMTCESCGDQMLEISGFNLACELSDEAESGVTKKGNAYLKVNEACKVCGANFEAYNETTEIECSEINEGYLKITKNNVLVLDMPIYYINNHSCPDRELKKIKVSDLTEKENCGGYIEVKTCSVCGKVVNVNYDNIIGWGLRGRMPAYSEFIDENGLTHEVETLSCEDCGIKIAEQKISVKLNRCDTYLKTVSQLIVDEEVIYEYVIEERVDSNHYHYTEYTYEMLGEACEDGYAVKEVCERCGYISKYKSSGHIFEVKDVARFPEPCIGNLEIEVCRVCGETVWRKAFYLGGHTLERVEEKNYTDEKGIEHYYYLEKCAECGVEVSHDEYTISGGSETGGDIVYVTETVTYQEKSYSYTNVRQK